MKKIGIMTFHRSENYGSVLQAYALAKAIDKIRGENTAQIIDYSNPGQRELYSIFLKNNSIKNIVKNIRAALNYSQLKRRKNNFNHFINNVLPVSEEKFYNSEELKNHKSNYEKIICGSDQIWNPQSVDFSMSFFAVDFDCKKYAYAPSIRNAQAKDFERYRDEVSNALSGFEKLSLREKDSIPVLQQFTDKKIDCVCDPTLLLDSKDFDEICSDDKIEGEYIFYYSIDYNAQSVEMVKYIADKLNMPVYIIFSTNKTYNVYFKGFHLSKSNAPGDFISLVKNARLVLSNSFHGTAFSVIYRKNFFALKANGYNDYRIADLLCETGLQSRYIDIDDMKKINLKENVEFNENAIQKMREKSLNYLEECLND